MNIIHAWIYIKYISSLWVLFYELIYFQVTRKKERKKIILRPIFSGWSSSKYSRSRVNFLPLSEICGHCWRWGNILDRAIYWFSILFPLSYFKMFSVKNKTSETTRSISFFSCKKVGLKSLGTCKTCEKKQRAIWWGDTDNPSQIRLQWKYLKYLKGKSNLVTGYNPSTTPFIS